MTRLFPFFLTTLLICSCSEESETRHGLSEPVLTRQYRKDSVTVIMSISETNILTSGKTRLLIDVHTPTEYKVTFPEIKLLIDPFVITDGYTEPIQTLPNGKYLHRRVWELVPNRAGNTTFSSFEILADGISIQTKPTSLFTRSLLPKDISELTIKDIADSITVLPAQQKKRQWIFTSILTITGIGILTLLLIQRRKPSVIIDTSPYEEALQILQNLPDDHLERIHRLTETIISYVGRQYGLPTTGRTVEEIIPLLPKTIRTDLEERLVVVEQIRFSNKVPDNFTDEWEAYVRSVIEDMKEVPCD